MAKTKKNNKQPQMIVKKKGGFFGKLIAFFVGIITGIVGVFGGIAAIVFLVLNNTLNETVDAVKETGTDVPFELTEYVTEDFANLTLLEAIQSVSGKIGGMANGSNSFQDLVNDSPFLAKQVGGWAEFLAGYGVPATEKELLSLNFTNIPDYLSSKVNSISLANLVSSFGEGIKADNGVICSLLYGTKDVHYTVKEDNSVELLPLVYTFHSATSLSETTFTDWDNNVYEYKTDDASQLAGWVFGETATSYIAQNNTTSADQTITYQYEIRSLQGDVLYKLSNVENTDTYVVYNTNDVIQKHTGLTIGDIMEGEGIMGVVNNIELFTLLSMNETTDKMMLALAGYEKDENGNIKVQEGKEPTTISSLMSGASELITGMKLADIFPVEESNKMMMALAYVDGDKSKPRTIQDLTNNSSDIITGMKLADLITIDPSNKMMMSFAYVDGDTSKPRSIQDLTSGSSDIINGMKLADLITIDPSNKMMMSFAYVDGDTSKPRSIQDLTSGSSDIINGMKLADLITIDPSNKMMMSFAYVDGDTSKPRSIQDLTNSSSDIINGMKLADLITIDPSNKMMMSFAYVDGDTSKPRSIQDLTNSSSDIINGMKLADLITIDPSNKMMMSFAYVDGDINQPRTIQDLTESSSDIVNGMKIADLITINPDDSLMMALAYVNGDTNNPRTIQDLSESNIMEELEIAQVLDLKYDSNPIMLALAYGDGYEIEAGTNKVYTWNEDGTKNYSSKKISQLTQNNDLINDMKLYIALDLDMNDADTISPLLRAIAFGKQYKGEGNKADFDYEIVKNTTTNKNEIKMFEGKTPKTISSLSGNFINDLELGELITIQENTSPQILLTLQHTTIGNLSNSIETLTLADMIEIKEGESPAILWALKDATLSGDSIANKVETLKLSEIITITEGESPAILWALKDATLSGNDSIANKVETLKLNQIIEINNDSPAILKALSNTTLSGDSIATTIEGLQLQEIIDINDDSPAILKALKEATLSGDDSIANKVETLKLNQIIEINSDSPAILQALSDTTLSGNSLADKVETLKLNQIITIVEEDDPTTPQDERSPAILRALSEATLSGEGSIATKIETLKLNQIIEINNDSPAILKALSEATLSGDDSIANKVETLKLNQIIEINDDSPAILKALSEATLSGDDSIGNKVNTLTLGEVIDTSDAPKLLQALAGATLGDDGDPTTQSISEKINTLTIGEMMDVGDNFILMHLKGSTLASLPTDISNLTIEEVFAKDVYQMNADKTKFLDQNGNEIDETVDGWEEKRVLVGTWKYLLDNDITVEDTEVTAHKLTDMGKLITNMTNNVQKASLRQLDTDGLLELDDTLLKKQIYGTSLTFGDLTISELFNMVGGLS